MEKRLFSQKVETKEGKFEIFVDANDGKLCFGIDKDNKSIVKRDMAFGKIGEHTYFAIEEKPVGIFVYIDYTKVVGLTVVGVYSVNQGIAPLMIVKDKVINDGVDNVIMSPLVLSILNSILQGDFDFDYIISEKIRDFKTDKMMERFLKISPEVIPILCNVLKDLKGKIPLNSCKPIFLQTSAPLFKVKIRELFNSIVQLLEMIAMSNIVVIGSDTESKNVGFTRDEYRIFKERLEATLQMSQVELIDIYIRNFGETIYGIALGILKKNMPFLLPFVIADTKDVDSFFEKLNNQISEILSKDKGDDETKGIFLMTIESKFDSKFFQQVLVQELEKRKEHFIEIMDRIADLIEVLEPYEE